MRVLLIEDNPGDARLIREMLRGAPGFTLAQSETLRAGVMMAEGADFDMVLLDLSLPDSHGVDTLRQARQALPDLPIVVLTGLDDETRGTEAVQAGAQDYLVKDDIDSKLLQRALRYARERHRSEQALRQSEQEYRSLIDDVFDTSMVAVLILDRHFNVVWLNEATETYFGIDRAEIIGQDKRLLIDDKLKCIFADPDDYSARLLKSYAEGSFTDRFECHVTAGEHRDERWLEHWSQPIRSGIFSGGRIEQYTDITDRKAAEAAEQAARQFAEALQDTAAALASTLELDQVLELVIANIDRVLPHHAVNILMLDAGDLRLSKVGDSNLSANGAVAPLTEALRAMPAVRHMLETGQPLVIPDLALYPAAEPLDGEPMRSYIGAPIVLQEELIGVIHLFARSAGFFDERAADRLSAFTEQVALAIQNARLYRRSSQLAAAEERQRIARDLHDAVSQTLFSSQTMAESALRQWETQPERARALMEDVYRLIAGALAEMRILLLELRPAALLQVDLPTLLRQLLQAARARGGLETHLETDDLPPLPPDVKMTAYRIVQEALNNVVKHAGASQVSVTAVRANGGVTIRITDDGRGFDPTQTEPTSLGLGIMRERADEIGAAVTVESAPERGTHVTLIWTP